MPRTARPAAPRTVLSRSLSFALTTLLLAACGAGEERVAGRDAGNETTGPAWRIDTVPMFDLSDDGAASEPAIGFAEGVARLPNGDVLVADRGLFSLRWFAPDASLRTSLGREGLGPNEFKYIARMWRCGDVVHVYDIERGKEQQTYAFDATPRGTLVIESPEGRVPYASACSPTGAWISMDWERFRELEPGRPRASVPFWISAPDGSQRASLGDLPGSERLVTPHGSRPHPLGKQPVLAIGRDRAYVGTADSFLVQAYTLDGQPAGVLQDADANLSTTSGDIERYKYRDTLGANARDREERQREWETFEFPPTVPAYDAMLVDAEDLVWIRRYPRSISAPAEWLVFSADGTRVATVQLPETLTVHEIGADYIAGIEVDPVDGRQSVRVYALSRGER
jgi:hypothetical protein